MPNSQNYWQEIDGKYIINYRVAGFITPVAVLSMPIQEMKSGIENNFLNWTIASSAGWAVVAFLYAMADITVFKDRATRKYPLWIPLLFGATLGFAKGFTASTVAWRMGIAGPEAVANIYLRSINATFIGLIGVVTSAFMLTAIHDYSVERKRLIEDYLFLENQVRDNSETIDEMKSNLSTKVDENITKVLIAAQKKIKKGDNIESHWEEIASTLRQTAENTIRPLSHEMWNARRREMQLTLGEFMNFVFKNINFRPAAIIPLYIVTTYFTLNHEGHIWHSTYVMIMKVILIWVLLEFAQLFLEMFRHQIKNLFIYICIGLIVLNYPITEMIYKATGFRESYLDAIDSFWFIFLVLVTGIADSTMRAQIYQIKTLKGLINEKRFELISKGRELDRMGREMAKYLHGTIQSKLMAAAMAVEIAGRKNDQNQLNLEIERALKTLQMPSKEYLVTHGVYFQDSLDEILQKWDGMIGIELIEQEGVELSEIESRNVVEIVNEGILNAFRHGSASHVTITLGRIKTGKIALEIADDGNGISSIKPGLGSSYFNTITRNWSLNNRVDSKGAVFSIEF